MVLSRATTSVREYDPAVDASQSLELLRPPIPMIIQLQPRKQNAAASMLADHGPHFLGLRRGSTMTKGMVLRQTEEMLQAC